MSVFCLHDDGPRPRSSPGVLRASNADKAEADPGSVALASGCEFPDGDDNGVKGFEACAAPGKPVPQACRGPSPSSPQTRSPTNGVRCGAGGEEGGAGECERTGSVGRGDGAGQAAARGFSRSACFVRRPRSRGASDRFTRRGRRRSRSWGRGRTTGSPARGRRGGTNRHHAQASGCRHPSWPDVLRRAPSAGKSAEALRRRSMAMSGRRPPW